MLIPNLTRDGLRLIAVELFKGRRSPAQFMADHAESAMGMYGLELQQRANKSVDDMKIAVMAVIAANNEAPEGQLTREQYAEVCRKILDGERDAGGFFTALMQAYARADSTNARRIEAAFDHIFRDYV
jgi:hypothetical protein